MPVAPDRLARYFYHGVSELDLVQRTPDDLAGAALAELELGERGACEVLRGALDEVELRHAVVEAACEPVRRDRHSTTALAARDCGDAIDDRLTGGGNSAEHSGGQPGAGTAIRGL